MQGPSYDFNNPGNVLSTVIVPTLADNAPSWSPPKEFKLDVTRHVKYPLEIDTRLDSLENKRPRQFPSEVCRQ